MDFGLVSVVLDAVIHASSMLSEHSDRKKQKKHDHLSTVIQQLDVDAVTAAIRPARLASFMKGAVDAAVVAPVLKSSAFRGLIKEMFLIIVTDHSTEKLDMVRKSMTLTIEASINSKAASDDVDFFCENITDSLKEACETVVTAVRASNPETLAALQSTALLKRLTTALENIDRHTQILVSSATPATMELRQKWLTTYRRLCEKDHGFIVPPDFDTSRKIAMSKLYVRPTISIAGPDSYRNGTVVSFDHFRSSIDRTILLGDPGGGKSTLSNYLTSFWATEETGLVPFHVTLRDYAKQPSDISIASFIEKQLEGHYQHPAPPGLIEELLISGEAVVVFDGLDELIDTTKRRAVSSVVELFGIKYPLTAQFITSRRVGYDQARLDPDIYTVRVISEFKSDDVRTYVHKWFACQDGYSEQEAEKLATSFIAQSESVTDLRTNPLMLALMCIIFRGENFIPRNRPAVYEKCSNLLFEKWDGHRAIEVPLEARAHVNAALMYVAHWMLLSGSGDGGVSYDKLVREMSTYLRGRAFETEDAAAKAAAEFVDFCKGRAWVFADAGTTAEGEPLFTFTHRTFMEYFAAFHLTRINDTPEKLARSLLPKVAAQEWDVVAQLAIQIEDKAVDQGSERALRVMIDEPRKRALRGRSNVLEFVGRCASFSTLSPAFMRDLTEKSLTLLFNHMNEQPSPEFAMLSPWLSVTRAGLIAHKDTLIEAHKSYLAEALKEPGSESWRVACEFIDLAVGLTWPAAVRSHSLWSTWWLTFSTMVRDFAPELRRFSAEHRSCRPVLLLSGADDLETTLGAVASEGDGSFIETYFATTDSEFKYFTVQNLSSILWELAATPLAAEDKAEFRYGEPLANAFLEAFWDGLPKRLGKEFTDRVSRGSFGDELKLRNNKPQAILDAGFLIGLIEYELISIRYKGHFPANFDGLLGQLIKVREKKSAGSDLAWEEYPLSPRVREFGAEWSAGTVSVFEESTALVQAEPSEAMPS